MTDPEQIAGQLTEAKPALSWRTAMDKIVEAMARAMCASGGYDPEEIMPNDGPRWRYYEPQATAALAVAGPMVLEMAAEECEKQRQEFLSPQYAIPQPIGSVMERFACTECATAIRNLKEQFNG